MNFKMLAAAGLMGVTTIVHVVAGTPEILAPVLAAELDPVVAATSFVVWHAITLLLALMTAGLIWLIWCANPAFFAFLMAMQIGFAALFLIVSIRMLDAPFALPQWVIFTLVVIFMGVGARPLRSAGQPREVSVPDALAP